MTEATLEQFALAIGNRLGVEVPQPIAPWTGLYDQLALDSFQAFEMLLVIEDMAENEAPPMEIPALFTLGDAYGYYLQLRATTQTNSEV